MTECKTYITCSSEDDKYLVKGGIGTYVGILAKELGRQGVDTYWITQSHTDQTFLERRSDNLLVDFIENGNGGYILSIAENLRKRVSTLGDAPAILEVPDWEGIGSELFTDLRKGLIGKNTLSVSRLHTPLVVTQRLNKAEESLIDKRQKIREKRQILASDVLSAPTEYVRDAVINQVLNGLVPEQPTYVIPNPVNVDDFSPSKILPRSFSIERFKDLTGTEICGENYNIFIIGSVEERKGVSIILDSVGDIVKTIPNAHFYFIGHYDKGDDPLNANKKLSPAGIESSLGTELMRHVHLVGYLDHNALNDVLGAGDIFPICYKGDNFPGVVAELALARRPMIAYLKGGVTEMVTEKGKILTPCIHQDSLHPSRDLTELIARSYNGQYHNEALLGQLEAHFRGKYNPRFIVNLMLEVYREELLRKKAAVGFRKSL